ncbi:hypothetical protein CHGG_07747 [Chaetomium globosum CBS 148.51]|uniref:Uncharacterized protein n=1 Tax=Chaetomium globosum (strain ATCC 6205 / CBS 148.51 / DSM 1962 / NBRC 6347 / NRRL 1970) TaxID=306901 RepID=Q2GWA7_CHAGB|nr:uncharacterized protein CHGG_07747 [Chaetomium globosum CBS 148.51]EAQ86494.1 hypothetical protein CHGG_07747 [Chaetomium globosum CBS 148.51]
MASESADVDAADAANAELASSCRRRDQDDCSPPPGPTLHTHGPSPSSSSNPPSSSTGPLPEDSSKLRRTSFPVSFPPIFFQRSKVPSASLAASTAEGRPIPLTDPANTNHTSALQKLNSKYPSAGRRHCYTPEASVARSSTYSQPVLVRTYSGPSPSQGSRSTKSPQHRPSSSSRGASRRVPLPSASTPGSGGPGRPIQPTLSDVGVGTTSSSGSGTHELNIGTYESNAQGVNMSRPYKAKKAANNITTATTTTSKLPLPWPWPLSSRQEPEEPKLPPLEAFSFKSFMADLETRGSDSNIGADLDRIAEICARSRYSLSNQYEVHVAPHGSGASFTPGAPPSSVPRSRKGHGHSRVPSHGHGIAGPTLQAITSDDENIARSSNSRRRSGAAKRRSAAYGTLETIMSSSRSSEEDKSKKKSAAELVGEVRGRAARKAWDNPSASGSSAAMPTGNSGSAADTPPGHPLQQQQDPDPASTTADATTINKLARKKSASFATAIMDTRNGRSAAAKKAGSSSSSDQQSKNKKTRKKKEDEETGAKPASALLSEPAQPQTSGSHLGVRTSRSGGDRRTSVSSTGERGGRAVDLEATGGGCRIFITNSSFRLLLPPLLLGVGVVVGAGATRRGAHGSPGGRGRRSRGRGVVVLRWEAMLKGV